MTDWRVEVNNGAEVLTNDDGLYDVEIVDTFNPFGDYATAFFDDLAGNLFDKFQRGTKVVFQYSNDGFTTVNDRFIGYVVNDLPRDSDGAEQLEVEAYSFDQFLRGDEVTNDQTGNTIFEALEDVIKTDVPPVEWDASLVDVENNQELTESYQGDNVEDFLLSIRQKSAGEIFTVTEDLKFKFERAEVERAPRDISNSQWIQHDLGEQGGETKNQVIVSYDDGNEAVIVDNTEDQLNIQDNLGAVGPGQQGESITLPDITNVEDAISAGEQFLQGRKNTLTGTVTTFDLIDAEPSQVLGVTIDSRGIDTDFRIAENKIRWRNETNELTLVEKKGADDDVLIAQSKTLDRVENRPRDNTVVADKTTDTDVECEISVTGNVGEVDVANAKISNNLRNQIRDGWINGTTVDLVDELRIGTDSRKPVRSDCSIGQLTKTVSATRSLPDDFSLDLNKRVGDLAEARELNIQDSAGNDLARAVLGEQYFSGGVIVASGETRTIDTATTSNKSIVNGRLVVNDVLTVITETLTVSGGDTLTVASGDTRETELAKVEGRLVVEGRLLVTNEETGVNLSLTADTNKDKTKSVVTNNGQTATRNIIADNNPATTSKYDFGNDSTTPTEANASLSTVASNELDALTLLDISTDSEFNNNTNIPSTIPVEVQNNQVELLQSNHLIEAEDAQLTNANDFSDANYSGGQGVEDLGSVGDFISFSFNLDYTIPANNWEIAIRSESLDESQDQNVYEVFIGQESLGFFTDSAEGLDWTRSFGGDFDLPAGGVELRIELDANVGASSGFDLVGVYDKRFSYNFDNTLNTSSGYLDGPELYPTQESFDFTTVSSDVRLDGTTVNQTYQDNNVSNNQSLTITPDGTTFNNSNSGSVAYGPERVVDVDVSNTLSRYPVGTNPQNATPRFGYKGQAIDSHEVVADLRAVQVNNIGEVLVRSFVDESTATGSTFAEAGQLSGSTLLTRTLLPEFDKQSNQQVISNEKLRWVND